MSPSRTRTRRAVVSRLRLSHPRTLCRNVIRASHSRPSAAPSPRVPDQGAGGAGRRRGRARPAVACPQPHRQGDFGDRRTATPGTVSTCSATLLAAAASPARTRARRVPNRKMCAARSREGREGNLVIFVVDASGSMAARDRMSAVSGATLSLLRDAYQRRDKVAVITFRQQDAQLLLPPTSSVHIAGRRLARFDTGGKTPLAQGLAGRPRRGGAREGARPGAAQPGGGAHRRACHRRTRPAGPRAGRRRAPGCRGCRGRGRGLRNLLCATGFGRAAGRSPRCTCGAAGPAAGRRVSTDRPVRSRAAVGRLSMPQGQPLDRPRRRPDHPCPPQRSAARRAHRRGQGQVDCGVRHGAAGMEPGLRRRGVPVRQERQVESGRGGRIP